MKSRTQRSAQNVLVGLGGQAIEMVLKFVGRTIFIYCLSAEYLGVNGLFGEILTMLSLAELGIGSAIVFALYKPLKNNDEKQIAALMNLYSKAYVVIGISVAVVGAALIPLLKYIIPDPGEIGNQIYPIYLFYLFNTSITYFFSYKTSLLTADQKNFIVISVKEICNISRTVLQSVALLITGNFYLYLFIESLLILANNIWISVYVDRKYSYIKLHKNEKLDKTTKKSLWSNIRALILIKVTTLLVNSTDNTIISIYGGLVEVGLYSNYNMFIIIFTNILGQIFGNISASIGNLNAEDDKEKSMDVFRAFRMANFWLFSFVSIGIVLLMNSVIELWIGSDYLLPISVVAVIAANFYTRGIQNPVWIFKDTYGLFKYGKYMGIVTAVINVGLSILLGSYFGLIGILGATFIARLFTGVWYDPYALYKHGFEKPVRRYYLELVLYTLLALAALGVGYLAICFIPLSGWLGFIVKFVIVCIVPNLLYFIVFRKTKSYVMLKEKVVFILSGILKKRKGAKNG